MFVGKDHETFLIYLIFYLLQDGCADIDTDGGTDTYRYRYRYGCK